jgi:hypothetical protein
MNNKLERIRKEAIVAQSRYYPSICLEGLRKKQNTSDRIASTPVKMMMMIIIIIIIITNFYYLF